MATVDHPITQPGGMMIIRSARKNRALAEYLAAVRARRARTLRPF